AATLANASDTRATLPPWMWAPAPTCAVAELTTSIDSLLPPMVRMPLALASTSASGRLEAKAVTPRSCAAWTVAPVPTEAVTVGEEVVGASAPVTLRRAPAGALDFARAEWELGGTASRPV